MPCFFCNGPAHPATGCAYSPRVLACYACTVEFWRWFRAHQNARARVGRDRRGRLQADFYAHATPWNANEPADPKADRLTRREA